MSANNNITDISRDVLATAIDQVLYPHDGRDADNFRLSVDDEDHLDDLAHLATLSDAYHKLSDAESKPGEYDVSNRLRIAFETAAEQLLERLTGDEETINFNPHNSRDRDIINTLMIATNARELILKNTTYQSSLDHKLLAAYTAAADRITEPYADYETLMDTNLTEDRERQNTKLLAAVITARENLIHGMTKRYAAQMAISLRNGNAA